MRTFLVILRDNIQFHSPSYLYAVTAEDDITVLREAQKLCVFGCRGEVFELSPDCTKWDPKYRPPDSPKGWTLLHKVAWTDDNLAMEGAKDCFFRGLRTRPRTQQAAELHILAERITRELTALAVQEEVNGSPMSPLPETGSGGTPGPEEGSGDPGGVGSMPMRGESPDNDQPPPHSDGEGEQGQAGESVEVEKNSPTGQ